MQQHGNRIKLADGEEGAGTTFVDEVREETIKYFDHWQRKYGSVLPIVAGPDANVTLPKGVQDTTGYSTLPPLKSHSTAIHQRVVGWMQTLGLRALNTFGGAHTQQICGRAV